MTNSDELSIKILDSNSIFRFSKKTFPEPIDHILARAGVCSLRAAATFLKNNDVRVNALVNADDARAKPCVCVDDGVFTNERENMMRITSRDFRVDAERVPIFINGEQIPLAEHLYFIIDKPLGVVCSRVSDRHKTIFEILPEEIKSHKMYEHLHCAGRLDSDTSGLVILTTNGVFSNYLMSPENHISKTYEVTLRDEVPCEAEKCADGKCGSLTQTDYVERFKNGIELPPEKKSEGFTASPAELVWGVERRAENRCTLTISEGKFHQVRRMFAAMGNEVVALRRTRYSNFQVSSSMPFEKIK